MYPGLRNLGRERELIVRVEIVFEARRSVRSARALEIIVAGVLFDLSQGSVVLVNAVQLFDASHISVFGHDVCN